MKNLPEGKEAPPPGRGRDQPLPRRTDPASSLCLIQVERIRPIRDGNGYVKRRQGKASSFFLENDA